MKLLIVVDMQNDFVNGALGSPEAQAIVPNVAKKITEYLSNDNGVLYTRDTHFTNYLETQEGKNLPVEHCLIGSDGWQIVPEVYRDSYLTAIIDKPTFGFHDLAGAIERIERNRCVTIDSVEFVGVCTDICVISNALLLKAFKPELPLICDSSCCAGVTPAKHEAALEVMRSCQINVI